MWIFKVSQSRCNFSNQCDSISSDLISWICCIKSNADDLFPYLIDSWNGLLGQRVSGKQDPNPSNQSPGVCNQVGGNPKLYRSRLWKPQALTETPSSSQSLFPANKSWDSNSEIKQLNQERVEDSGVREPFNYQDRRETMNTSSTLYLTIIATALSVTILSKLNFKCTFWGKMYFPKFHIVV